MPPNIVLAPCSNEVGKENLEKSVLNPVSPKVYQEYTDLNLEEAVGIWGTGEHTKGTWNRINEGDFLLFYTGDRNYQFAGEIVATEVNTDLAVSLWSESDDEKMRRPIGQQSWKNLIYLRKIEKVDIDSSELHDLASYVRDYPMQFKFLREQGVESIVERYGSVEQYISGDR